MPTECLTRDKRRRVGATRDADSVRYRRASLSLAGREELAWYARISKDTGRAIDIIHGRHSAANDDRVTICFIMNLIHVDNHT